jgi:hypothetical protein
MSPWRRQQYSYGSFTDDLCDRKVNTKEEEEKFKEMKLCEAEQFQASGPDVMKCLSQETL